MAPPGQNERRAPKGPRWAGCGAANPSPQHADIGSPSHVLLFLLDFVADHTTHHGAADGTGSTAVGQYRSGHAADCSACRGRPVLAGHVRTSAVADSVRREFFIPLLLNKDCRARCIPTGACPSSRWTIGQARQSTLPRTG